MDNSPPIPEQTVEHIKINGTMIPKPPLFLYDPRLFMVLIGRRKSPLLSLLDSDSFDRVLAHCGPFQKTVWTRWDEKSALKEWLAKDIKPSLQDLSLLILGIKHWPDRNRVSYDTSNEKNKDAKPGKHIPIWRTVFTLRALAFEIRCQEQLVAAGALHWWNSLLFATPSDGTNTRAYVRLHMGKMGPRASPDRPVRAHIGLVTPFQQKKKKTVDERFFYYSDEEEEDDDEAVEERFEEVARLKWSIEDCCTLSFDEITGDEWRTVLSMQALSLRIMWAN